MIQLFHLFGKAVSMVAIIGLAAVSVETMTGIVLIPGMENVETGIQTTGTIAIALAGAFPMTAFITKPLKTASGSGEMPSFR